VDRERDPGGFDQSWLVADHLFLELVDDQQL
jgi:hypothetical protein